MRHFIGFFIGFFIFFGCSAKEDFVLFYKNDTNSSLYSENYNTPNRSDLEANNVKFEYKILPHDRVSLIVYKHPEFSTSTIGSRDKDDGILVDSDGYISLPVVDEVHIAGLTQKEARRKVERAFSRYLKYSKVKLEVLNKRAYIVGEVNKPGEFELFNEKTTLLKFLAKAGDLKKSADRKNIILLRERSDGKIDARRLNLVSNGSLVASATMIRPNDVVYVPPKEMNIFNSKVEEIDPLFRVVGHVLAPFVNIKYLTD